MPEPSTALLDLWARWVGESEVMCYADAVLAMLVTSRIQGDARLEFE